MTCTPFKTPDGGRGFICGPRARTRKCCACSSPSTLLCDWKVGKTAAGKPKTCDKPICALHAVGVAPEKDLCPEHAAAYRQWQADRMGKPL